MHSIVYDRRGVGRHVVFADDITTGPQDPPDLGLRGRHRRSWVKIGDVTGIDQPNLTPMAPTTAWGSTTRSTAASRDPRADFYAGNFDQCEQVAILSRRAAYGTFLLRDDVWAVAFNGEHIASSPDIQPEGPGSTMCDVWLVSADGSLVSGGMESVRFLTQPGVLSGVRPWFPSRMRGVVDHKGMLWVNMPVGPLRSYAAVLATQGWTPGRSDSTMARSVILDQRVPLLTMRGDAPADGYVRFIEPYPNYVIVQIDITSSATRSSVQQWPTTTDSRVPLCRLRGGEDVGRRVVLQQADGHGRECHRHPHRLGRLTRRRRHRAYVRSHQSGSRTCAQVQRHRQHRLATPSAALATPQPTSPSQQQPSTRSASTRDAPPTTPPTTAPSGHRVPRRGRSGSTRTARRHSRPCSLVPGWGQPYEPVARNA